MLDITVKVPMQIASIETEDVHVTKGQSAFEKLCECAAGYRVKYTGHAPDSLGAIEGVQVARSLFRALGMDPTKTRPASEALLRRALKDQSLFCINTLVDVVSWWVAHLFKGGGADDLPDRSAATHHRIPHV